jgi:rubrerythrin
VWLFAEIKEEVLDETDGLGAWQSYPDYYLEPQLAEPFASEMASYDQSASIEALAMNSFSPVIDNTYSLIEGVSAENDEVPSNLNPEGTVLDSDIANQDAKFVIRRRGRPKQTLAVQVDDKLSSRKEPERRQPTRKGKDSVAYFAKQPKLNVSKQISRKYRLKRNLDAASEKLKAEKQYDPDTSKLFRGKRGEGAFICNQCQYRFRTSNSLQLHYAVHMGETTCPVCSRVFSRKDDMHMHLYSIHYADKNLLLKVGKRKQCWLCPVSVKSPSNLRVHMARDHLDYTRCPLCEEKFHSKSNMLHHLSEWHEHETTC